MADIPADRWRILSPYLDQVLDLDEGDRAAWLVSLHTQNPEIAAQVSSLLRERNALALEGFLETSPSAPPGGSSLAGQTVGPYTLLSQIGQGGMGSVWLAQRSDGRFTRRVAVKFLNIALAGRAGEERFKREGSILGRLAHPNIAELLDAGVSASGVPYLVLEYVEGDYIDRYCDENNLEVEARLCLFLDVCSAVAHAHANLIVHRDLKPSNVLVRKDGQVKLLDFGIAKLLEREGQEGAATLLTVQGGRAMTPQYAAPEQVTGATITTATDVYAIGVLLYVLLTGQHPAGVTQSHADLVKAIVDTEPRRPSEIVTSAKVDDKTATANAARRTSTPEKLRRLLRGDLDTIVSKALKKNQQERYASVPAMAEDISRYLKHEPISVRPDTVAYRASKFLRRHPAPVAVTVLVIVGLSAGLFEVNRERVMAQRRFEQLRRLSNRVFFLDEEIRGVPGTTDAREHLVGASLEYLERLAADAPRDLDLAEEVADGLERVANIQGVPTEQSLGHFDQAEQTLKKAEALTEMVLAARPGNRRALYTSARIAHARMVLANYEQRREDTLAFAQRTTKQLDEFLAQGRVTNDEQMNAASFYGNVSLAYRGLHRRSDAVLYARKAVELQRTVPGESPYLGTSLAMLATVLRDQGDLEEALNAIREARAIAERSHGRDEMIRMLTLHGVLYWQGMLLGEADGVNLGRSAEAEEPLQKAVDIAEEAARKNPGDYTSRSRVASTAGNLANILREKDPQRALQLYDLGIRRLTEVQSNVAAVSDRAELLALSSYALRSLRRSSEAQLRIETALAIFRKTGDYPAQRLSTASGVFVALRALADFDADEGDLRHAVAIYEELLEKVMAAKPDPANDLRDATKLSGLYGSMARLYRRQGDETKADGMIRQRLELWQRWDRNLPGNAFVQRQLEAANSQQT
ncbi:MAG TPA: serine/threonine-protein kinase [Terriglobales bacterium]|nr:serine/threonine-protein kinase [Terriglobales bacterium]